MRAVRFTRFGGPEILRVEEIEQPRPGPGEVPVRVEAAGLNPVDWKIFSGKPTSAHYERTLPWGNGFDFAGVVVELGDGVDDHAVGDAVMGGRRFHAQAEYVAIAADGVVGCPKGVPIVVAGALDIVARTAEASVESQDIGRGDVVLVSAAAGGVGLVVAQLCVARGATVIGTASERNHEWLRSRGVAPVFYGAGLADRVRAATSRPVDVVLDNQGRETVATGLELGVPATRINSIADYDAVARLGIADVGGAAAGLDAVARIGELIVQGVIELPIDSVWAFDEATAAYDHLIEGHLRGKVALVP